MLYSVLHKTPPENPALIHMDQDICLDSVLIDQMAEASVAGLSIWNLAPKKKQFSICVASGPVVQSNKSKLLK